jgi:hypothetical protein
MPKHCALAAAAIIAFAMTGCAKPPDDAQPVATPSVTLDRTEVAIGSPVEVTYRFVVAADAPPFDQDYVVFVHFQDADGALMWTDDHQPPMPTRQWKPGSAIEYQRTVFAPKLPYVGEVRIQMGLYSPDTNMRLPMEGDSTDGRAYRVATFQMKPQTDDLFVVFKEGWHGPEVADDGGLEWHWSKKAGALAFRNPKRDVVIMILVDMPVPAFPEPQQVEIRIGSAVVDTFALAAGQRQLRRIPLSAAQAGDAETVEMAIAVDKTFVPARVPQLRSADGRELGVRVFRVHIEPK